MLAPIISNNINQITALCKQHHVKELYVFGSAARNEMKDESDVDFLYEFGEEIDIIDYANNYFNFAESMEKLLGKQVDLVAAKYLKNRVFIKRLNETKQMLFAA